MTSQSDSKQPPRSLSPASMAVPQLPSPIHTEQPKLIKEMNLSPESDSSVNLRGGGRHYRHHHSHTGRDFAKIALQLWVVYAAVNVVNAVAAYDRKDKRDSKVIRISE
ncbi:hypothetical protein BOTNAR_0265g00130 [Botryotinia narcissicola]|uniref:Uncharacterized protein n=1 Tax=Botryotinia narcissicola TaxID=278944 RepID=A0A4Z1I6S8_9HELO|nr:hypothetical protein BOTNAR_0265g00130 [Botryotinia narcissicola]